MMDRAWAGLLPITCFAAILAACQDTSQSPPSRPEPPRDADAPEGTVLAPVDLIYVCGNKFLATNSTGAAVHVTYRVVGTGETGSLTLSEEAGEDPGHSETELETTERGAVELYQDDERVARRRNEGTSCGAAAASTSVAALGISGSAGEWSTPFSSPVVSLHMSLLPTGKVLSWGFDGMPQVWDPTTGTFTGIPSPALLFCAGHSFLADGRLLVSGGHVSADHGIPDNTIFTPGTQTWSRSTPMRRGRWYPTSTTLANGDVVILAGTDENGVTVEEPEVWSSGSVRVLTTAKRLLPYYPRAFLAPNGKLFYAGHQQTTRYLDPTGTGSWTTVGNRLYGVRDYGAAVMYEPGKILYVGGGRTTNTAEVIDLNAAAPAWRWTGSMAFPRRSLNATVLPTGDVLVTGGTSGTASKNLTMAAHAAELWSPTTGTWTTLASNSVRRGYHSTSILLPDGRVLHAGSGDATGMPNERNAELFSPPYLFSGPRPVITAAPSLVAYGTSFRVNTPDAADIAKVSLIRLGSTTHAFDMNQRFQWLSFERESGALSIELPGSRNRTPPGHYMLFILNGDGVPSVAKIVNVGTASEPDPSPPPKTGPTAAFTQTCDGFTCAFTDRSTDDGGVTGWSWAFGDGGTSSTQNPSHIYPAEGPYQVTLTATDNDLATGTITKMVTVAQPAPANVPPTAAFTHSCTGLTCRFTDRSTDSDGSVTAWRWTFGNGGSGTARNPSRTYAAAGTYTVSLTVTDNDGATQQNSAPVTVTPSIVLTVTGRTDATKQYMILKWTGARGTQVAVYRNNAFLTNTANDGRYTNSRLLPGASRYTYKVCEVGTSICSNVATVVFR